HYAYRVYEDALSIAPSTKVLYGSDAPGLPDFFWLAGVVHRRALGRVLDGWLADGLSTVQAESVARNVSYRNAAALYEVDLP
ncbi:MAG: amidohydrolase, partial [Dehalococcoidia bacterium]|nr:amidohydrolase [Dehalococcoidia bacterium]